MKFYLFDQNNSGGVHLVEGNKFDTKVVIEAETADAANIRAQEIGIYFDVECEIDCECCGSRWFEASEYDGYESLTDIKLIRDYVIHYAVGTVTHER